MSLKLTIDEGNSSTKLALWHDDDIISVASHRHASYDIVRKFLPKDVVVDAAIFCSVRGRSEDVIQKCIGRFARRLIVLSARTPLPVAIDYGTPETLGVDRIAAAVGATVILPDRALMVVDMGTAITYDLVSADGHFLGGNIAPGIFLRLEALSTFTEALPLVETDGDVPRLGYDTATALRAGAIRGVVGELQYYRHSLRTLVEPANHKKGLQTVLTGGSADLILPFITTPIIHEPNLVLIGLNRILDYNENL